MAAIILGRKLYNVCVSSKVKSCPQLLIHVTDPYFVIIYRAATSIAWRNQVFRSHLDSWITEMRPLSRVAPMRSKTFTFKIRTNCLEGPMWWCDEASKCICIHRFDVLRFWEGKNIDTIGNLPASSVPARGHSIRLAYEGVSKSFRTSRLERELQMV
jgi:hypothetical protein